MRVAEVMHTPPVTIGPRTTLRDAAQTMDARNVGCLLIVDQVGYLAGVVTDRDLAVRGVALGMSVEATVENVMTRDLATVSPHADLDTAAGIMRRRGVRRVPVTDEMGRALGILTVDDILRALGRDLDELAGTVVEQATHGVR